MHIQFCGGAGEVTGSRYHLDTGRMRLLLDAGLFQGHRQAALQKNRALLFKPQDLDAVLLSHAHIDHSGGLPLLVRSGYQGPIYSTGATRDLCGVMLPDSGRLQEDDAAFFNKIHAGDAQRIAPIYTEEDAHETLGRFKTIGCREPLPLGEGASLTFLSAGHVLGSAMIQLDLHTANGPRRIVYTGDLGRRNAILMKSPDIPRDVDVLLIESTYGDRVHPAVENAEEAFGAVLRRAVAHKGKVLIPSFALERTQEVVFILEKLRKTGKVPPIPLYVDSPMAVSITEIFHRHLSGFQFAPEFRDYLAGESNPFGYGYVRYLRSSEESKRLNATPGPLIVIAASGMCEGGRILHHLRHSIDQESTAILLVGYQAEGTLGRRLADGQRRVRIFGYEHEVKARVQVMPFFSAHADQGDLLAFIGRLEPPPRKIFLVHGDPVDRRVLAERLRARGFRQVESPNYGDTAGIDGRVR